MSLAAAGCRDSLALDDWSRSAIPSETASASPLQRPVATEWARFVTAAADADGQFPLTVPLRQEHYPFWAPEDLGVARRELLRSQART